MLRRGVHRTELFASLAVFLVVFLVAPPLCVGVALVSGVPAGPGLVTGAVGALGAGLLRLALRAPRLGCWFRAVPVTVVQGTLAGIGLVLVTGQVYALGDAAAPGGGLGRLTGLVSLPGRTDPVALSVGGATMVVLLLWGRWGRGARLASAPLVAIASAAGVTWAFGLDVRRVRVQGLWDAVRVPEAADPGRLAEVGVIGAVVAFTLIASAESSLGGGAAAEAARAKAARVVAGGFLPLFAVVVPGVLGLVPVAATAGVLVCVGCGLVPVRETRALWRGHRGEALVLGVTAVAIVAGNLFEGVLIGLALAVAKTAWEISQVRVETEDREEDGIVVRVVGHATFLRLPKLLDALDALPHDRRVRLELAGLRHADHACAAALEAWEAARERREERQRASRREPRIPGAVRGAVQGTVQGDVATSTSTS